MILRRSVAACSLICCDTLSPNIHARVSHQTWHLPYSFQARPHTGAVTHLQSAAQDSSQKLSGNTSPSAVVRPPSCVWLGQNHKVKTSPKPHSRWNWLELLCMAEMFILLIGFFLYYTGHWRTERKVEGEESGHDPYQLPICHVPQLQHDWNFPDILLRIARLPNFRSKRQKIVVPYLFMYLFIHWNINKYKLIKQYLIMRILIIIIFIYHNINSNKNYCCCFIQR